MSLNEFELIKRYFACHDSYRSDVVLGIGDDAAIVQPRPGSSLAIAADVLNEGIHFPASTHPSAIGYKALAVNLSDLAAMGAVPRWFTMTLSLPRAEDSWLRDFASGLFALADQFQVALVGGDTVRGPLSIGIHLVGEIDAGVVLQRSGARSGDRIYVSGSLGSAAVALHRLQEGTEPAPGLRERLDQPVPRVDLGRRLVGLATSCIDISDGILADLGHVLEASDKGASIELESLPLPEIEMTGQERLLAIRGGDDYELCFTAPANLATRLESISAELDCPFACIGEIHDKPGLVLNGPEELVRSVAAGGYDHFGEPLQV